MGARKAPIPELSPGEVALISPKYAQFVQHFSEADANRVLQSGSHLRERTRKTDYFIDCVAVAVAYDCFTTYHDEHGFESPSEEYLTWTRDNIPFAEYLGDKNSPVEGYKKKFKALDLYR
ncbi:hypothetical protein SEA_FORZA_121 [Gordonia phage Forza]|uniref:Uncharacterized protein n=1 Tax=Gordonia phage Forza TaxID=2571247 RepID=A0A650EYI5_9CAUD|nr:hypothetical protein PP303_gp121 [Gordonia phage Forza]QEM41588.1 hypothetical protein SEA_BOOPY_121 [Gordonia phage Boopy]QGT55114.1 hypothetical protein SEA_FORZA_121 [Gordonia phage Forza]UXE04262.1 hypothetical protein SEA_BLUENGOLD_120 [Gordonia phage BlueNGold]WBF03902.1 hypothetical protein SEA_MAREELIH_119 [Gordonia phage Mareelih]